MPRAIWTGAISFGLVNVPVKLFSAVQRKGVRFNQLDSEGNVRIKMQRVNPQTGEEVPVRAPRQGLRGRARPVRRRRARRARGARAAAHPDDRHPRLRRARRHRPDLLRPPVLPRAGRGRLQAVQAPARRDARDGQGRDRQGRHPPEGGARRACARTATCCRWTRSSTSTRSSRRTASTSAPDEGDRGHRPRARDRQAARRVARRPAGTRPSTSDEYREKVLQLIEQKAAGEEIAVQPAAEEAAPVPDLMAALKAASTPSGPTQPEPQAEAPAEGQEAGARASARRPARAGRPRGWHRPSAFAAPTRPSPASAAAGAGKGFVYLNPDDTRVDDAEVLGADQRARDPARLGGRLDLAVPRRPHPGHRASTPAGASSTCTTRSGAPGATRRSSTTCCASPARCRAMRERRRPATSRARRSRASRCSPARCGCSTSGFFRIGSEDYASTNKTYGLATMRKAHVTLLEGDVLLFDYPAKHGKRGCSRSSTARSPRSSSASSARRGGLPELLAYKRGRALGRRAVPRHQRATSRTPPASRSPRRTSARGTPPSSRRWRSRSPGCSATTKTGRKRAVARAIKEVAHYLGNTPAVARASYIDPRVFDRFNDGLVLDPTIAADARGRAGDPGGRRGGGARPHRRGRGRRGDRPGRGARRARAGLGGEAVLGPGAVQRVDGLFAVAQDREDLVEAGDLERLGDVRVGVDDDELAVARCAGA